MGIENKLAQATLAAGRLSMPVPPVGCDEQHPVERDRLVHLRELELGKPALNAGTDVF
jgi:hypothetical protein